MIQNRHISRLGRLSSLLVFFILCSSLFISCCHDPHEGEHGLAIALGWQDEADKGTNISDLRLWIYKENGELVDEYRYDNARDIASRLYELPAGDYVLVAAANLVEPFTVEEGIGNGVKPYEGLMFALSDADASQVHAFYGVTEVSVQGEGVEQTSISLRRVLAELDVTIEGVPDGTRLVVSVTDAATALLPACKDTDGEYGVATNRTETVTLPEAVAADGKLNTVTMRLMPTATDNDRSHLHFGLALADGTVQEFDADAPVMEPSGKYRVTLQYADMKPYMQLHPVSISNWTEGWTIGGEILNPDK